jgi:hypothetical protein
MGRHAFDHPQKTRFQGDSPPPPTPGPWLAVPHAPEREPFGIDDMMTYTIASKTEERA